VVVVLEQVCGVKGDLVACHFFSFSFSFSFLFFSFLFFVEGEKDLYDF